MWKLVHEYLPEIMIAIVVAMVGCTAGCVRYAAIHGFSKQAITLSYTLAGLDIVCFFAIILNLPSDFPEGLLKGGDSSDFRTRNHAAKH